MALFAAPTNSLVAEIAQGGTATIEPKIMQSYRVYLQFDLARLFVQRGEMVMRWARLPVKELGGVRPPQVLLQVLKPSQIQQFPKPSVSNSARVLWCAPRG